MKPNSVLTKPRPSLADIYEHTPVEITDKIERFARTLAKGQASYIPLRPSPTAKELLCVGSVDEVEAAHGGTRVMGWKIWECRYWFKAVYHAVWQTPEGELVDVTPEPGEVETLFVVDDKERPSVYVPPRIEAKKAAFKKVVMALSRLEALYTRANERINKGGIVPLGGGLTPVEHTQIIEAKIKFNVLLAKALAKR